MSRQSVQFCIENSEGPVYFRIGESSGNNKSDRNESEKLLRICEKPQAYLSSFKQNFCFAKNIDRHFKLKNEIRSHLDETQSLTSIIAYGSDGGGGDGDDHFEYGYLLSIPSDDSLQSLLEKLKKTDLIGESPRFTTSIINDNVFAKFSETDPQELVSIHLVPSPEVHPAYMSMDTNSVYHSIEKVYEVLSHFVYLNEVQELLAICEKYIKNDQKWREMLPLQASSTFIVVEGLDATGKSSLTMDLARELDGTGSPLNDISHLRAKFDSHPQLLRRAFYALGNYAFAVKVVDLSKKGVVICDRFWNSTAAYAIATDVSVGGIECLPPQGHNVYKWPADLLKPDVVLLLTVGDEERKRRLVGRGSAKTDEEIRLEVSSDFRNRLKESYLRMQGPKMLKIDVSGTKQEVLEKTLAALKSHNII